MVYDLCTSYDNFEIEDDVFDDGTLCNIDDDQSLMFDK